MRRPFRIIASVLVALQPVLAGPSDGAGRLQAPVERGGFTRLTSYDTLQAFLADAARLSGLHSEVIATTRQGRSVTALQMTPGKDGAGEKPRLKVLVFAQQHGNEPSGKEAMTLLVARWREELAQEFAGLDLRVIPQMNPDGAELRQRGTSDSIDLNRSHLLLHSPETAALHRLFLAWQPEVTLDVHEYGAYSRSWSDSGYIKRGDVQLGMLTNLNSPARLRAYQREFVFPSIASAMSRAGYAFNEYIVGSPQDRIRHSTTEINDGRQSFGILGTLSFIQEGWKGRTLEENLERRTRSQFTAIEALLRFCNSHADEIRELVAAERKGLAGSAGKEFALRMEHVHGTGTLQIPVRLVASGRDTMMTVGPYHDVVRPTATTRVPSAYVVPSELGAVIELLTRHGVRSDRVDAPRSQRVETIWIDSVGYDVLEEDSIAKPSVRTEQSEITLRPGDVVIPTAQWHGMFLPTALEPVSMWGLTKYEPFADLLKQKRYPIYRIP